MIDFVLVPTILMIRYAMRFSRPVLVIAAAMNKPAATKTHPLLTNPLIAKGMALPVPSTGPLVPCAGANPRKTMVIPIKDMALTPYGTASVIHMSTVKAMIPSMRFPATDKPGGVGAMMIAAMISKLTMMMIGFLSNDPLLVAMLVAVAFCIVDPPA
jgi:hypothetical protein